MKLAFKLWMAEFGLDKKLKNCNYENTPTYSLTGKRCKGKILKVYDGDTVWVALPIPNDVYKYKARLFGYDSPEMRPSKEDEKHDEIVQSAIGAKKRLQELICENELMDVELLEFDKYGRILIKLYGKDGHCINDQMVQEGFGKPYFGGKKS
jgi:endonuclease YncB( thermonuclease family)